MKHLLPLIILLTSVCGAENIGSTGFAEPRLIRAIEDRWLQARTRAWQNTPSALLVFESGDKRPLISSKIDNFDVNSPIHVASASKWISAAVILRLVDRGEMRLNQVVGDYFQSHDLSISVRNISLHELLSFRSGLKNTTRHRNPCKFQKSLQLCATELLKSNASTDGQHDFDYGNVHLLIAGAMAEKASGLSWSELYQRELVAPLKLQHKTYYSAGVWKRKASVPLVAGGLVISTTDYLTFLRTIASNGKFNGQQWLKPNTVTKMLTTQFLGSTRINHSPFSRLGKRYQYGYGNWIECQDEACRDPRNSSPGLYGFYPWIDRKHNKFGILAMESSLLDIKASLKSAQVLDKLWELLQRLSNSKSPSSTRKQVSGR